MSGFLFGATMRLMMGAGMMAAPGANRMRRMVTKKARCAMRKMMQ